MICMVLQICARVYNDDDNFYVAEGRVRTKPIWHPSSSALGQSRYWKSGGQPRPSRSKLILHTVPHYGL